MTRAAFALILLASAAPAAVMEHDPQIPWVTCLPPGLDDIMRNPGASIMPPQWPWQRQERSQYFETPPGRWRAGGGDALGWAIPAGGTVIDRGGASHQKPSVPAPIPLPAIGTGLLFALIGAALTWWRMR